VTVAVTTPGGSVMKVASFPAIHISER